MHLTRAWILMLAVAPWLGAQDAGVDMALAETQYREERFDAAARSFQVLRAQAETSDEKDFLSLRIVRVLLALGKTRRATLELRRLTDRKNPYPPALVEKARLHLELLPEEAGAMFEVERSLRKAKALEPDSPGAWVQWGNFARARGRFREALDRYRKVIDKLDPSYPEAHFGVARVQLSLNRPEKALEAMAACLEAAPREGEAHWFAGNVRWAVGGEGWKEAVLGHYQDAMAYASTVSRYKGAAMVVHYLDQDPESAEPILSLLEVEAPHGSYTWLGRGMRAELEGQVMAAKNAYQMALGADARNVWAHFFLAGIVSGLGNRSLVGETMDAGKYKPTDLQGGIDHYRVVYRQAPEFPFRSEVKAALRQLE